MIGLEFLNNDDLPPKFPLWLYNVAFGHIAVHDIINTNPEAFFK